MPDTFTTITNAINSPPGQLVAGGVLAGIVWKFFEKVETLLTDAAKFEIAVWLVGVKVGQKVEPWAETFGRLIDRVFGTRHPTWTGLRRSFVATILTQFLILLLVTRFPNHAGAKSLALASQAGLGAVFVYVGGSLFVCIVLTLPDYAAIITLQGAIHHIFNNKGTSGHRLTLLVSLLGPLLYVSMLLLGLEAVTWGLLKMMSSLLANPQMAGVYPEVAAVPRKIFEWYEPNMTLGTFIRMDMGTEDVSSFLRSLTIGFPLYFSSIWLWLYAGSGFLLKFARRFDLGFAWFNRKFDIEKKPLSAIGLVAGALVAMMWWSVCVVRWIVVKV